MKPETIVLHSGYDIDRTTRAVAVPIYQTVSFAFDSADHGRRCSISKLKGTGTAGSAILQMLYWKGALPPWKAEVARCASALDRLRCTTQSLT